MPAISDELSQNFPRLAEAVARGVEFRIAYVKRLQRYVCSLRVANARLCEHTGRDIGQAAGRVDRWLGLQDGSLVLRYCVYYHEEDTIDNCGVRQEIDDFLRYSQDGGEDLRAATGECPLTSDGSFEHGGVALGVACPPGQGFSYKELRIAADLYRDDHHLSPVRYVADVKTVATLYARISDNVLEDEDWGIIQLAFNAECVISSVHPERIGVYRMDLMSFVGMSLAELIAWTRFDATGHHPENYHELASQPGGPWVTMLDEAELHELIGSRV